MQNVLLSISDRMYAPRSQLISAGVEEDPGSLATFCNGWAGDHWGKVKWMFAGRLGACRIFYRTLQDMRERIEQIAQRTQNDRTVSFSAWKKSESGTS